MDGLKEGEGTRTKRLSVGGSVCSVTKQRDRAASEVDPQVIHAEALHR